MHALSYNCILYAIRVHHVVNSLIVHQRPTVDKYMAAGAHTHTHTQNKHDWFEVTDNVLLMLLKCATVTAGNCMTRQEGACDHYYFYSFYFKDLRHSSYSVFTHILPLFHLPAAIYISSRSIWKRRGVR